MLLSLRRLKLEIQRLGASRVGVDKDVTRMVIPFEFEDRCPFTHFCQAVSGTKVFEKDGSELEAACARSATKLHKVVGYDGRVKVVNCCKSRSSRE